MRRIIPHGAKLIPASAQRVFKGVIYDVYQWQQKMYDGSLQTFEMLKRPDTVKVIAVKDDKIVILKQKQPDSDSYFYDLPGGRHDEEDEDELQAAKRELLEETGMTFKNWQLLDVSQPHGKIEQFIYVFLATGLKSQTEQKLDAGEKIEIKLIDLQELKNLSQKFNARYLPKEIFQKVDTIEDLISLPEFVA